MARAEAPTPAPRLDAALLELVRHATAIGFDLQSPQLDRLRTYLDTLLLWNRRMPLVSQQDPGEITRKHFVDSLMAARECLACDSVVDLGSGAGFPGLVIAIVCPRVSVSLVDANRKKASFMVDVAARTALRNLRVVEGRIEQVGRAEDHHKKYSIAISRALGSLAESLRLARPFLRPDGRAIAMRGPRYAAELDALGGDGSDFAAPRVEPYTLPDGARRAILSFSLRAEG